MQKPAAYVAAAPGYYVIGPMLQTDAPLTIWRMPVVAWAVEEHQYDNPRPHGDVMFATCEPICAESLPSNWHAILDPMGRVTVPSEFGYATLDDYLADDDTKAEAAK